MSSIPYNLRMFPKITKQTNKPTNKQINKWIKIREKQTWNFYEYDVIYRNLKTGLYEALTKSVLGMKDKESWKGQRNLSYSRNW